MNTYSQSKQDMFLENTFFRNTKNGTFVDIGANDGVTFSNTKLFEERGWTGICVEPLPLAFKKLKSNRKCVCVQGVVSEYKEEHLEFCKIEGYSEMLSGLIKTYNEQHKRRILNELDAYGGTKEKILVKNYSFNKLVNFKKINLLCVDTEGSEYGIISSINFDEFEIDVIVVENNYANGNVKNLLETKNYKLVSRLGPDEIYSNNNFVY